MGCADNDGSSEADGGPDFRKNHLHLGLNFHKIRNQDVKSAVIW
jgi:hypothetical protein